MRRLWKWLPGWVRWMVKLTMAVIVLIAITAGLLWLYAHPYITRTDGIVYGARHGEDLVMDVLTPRRPNGLGVAVMVSGSWRSGGPGSLDTWLMAPLLRGGYTVFALCHVSQPRATVMEIIEDAQRGIRFIRHHAEDYAIDPNYIGVTGGSSGGHLSLMLASVGGPNGAGSTDPIEAESSAVQAVAIFFPVTDLLNLGSSTENPGDGGPPKSYVKAFGPNSLDMPVWKVIGRESSPIYHVHQDLPPILIHHGDADTLTPLEQSLSFQRQAQAQGAEVSLHIHPGGKHGWLTMPWDIWQFARWFDRHLNPNQS